MRTKHIQNSSPEVHDVERTRELNFELKSKVLREAFLWLLAPFHPRQFKLTARRRHKNNLNSPFCHCSCNSLTEHSCGWILNWVESSVKSLFFWKWVWKMKHHFGETWGRLCTTPQNFLLCQLLTPYDDFISRLENWETQASTWIGKHFLMFFDSHKNFCITFLAAEKKKWNLF